MQERAWIRRAVVAIVSIAAIAACSGRGDPTTDAGQADDVARARALDDDAATLPSRPDVISLAQSVEAQAQKEGAGARATSLHALAAHLHERMFRVEHREQDAKEAIDLYRAAGRDLALPGGCEAAIRGAKLSGELAMDAHTTYAELYRVKRRSSASDAASGGAANADSARGGSADGGGREGADGGKGGGADGRDREGSGAECASSVDAALALVAAFRPPPPVLEAIEQGLAGEGAIPAPKEAFPKRTPIALPHLTRIEQWTFAEGARIVVHLDHAAQFRYGDAASAGGRNARTYVELDGVELGAATRETPLDGIVSRIVAEPTTTGSRVLLDLVGPAYRRVFHLLEPFRIVIDIARRPPGTSGGNRSVGRIVLDPGHGGYDPGASGPSGLKEKDVTLAVAHRAAPILARHGIEVALTRDDDRFVTLEERTARANAFGADLFVSIHCNAAENAKRRGVETYVLDTSANEMAGRVAARENGASQAASNEVARLLASMRLADQGPRSTRLAELLLRAGLASLNPSYEGIIDGGVHRAGFYVLVGARMPAVLFETSYISNAVEEQRLGAADYQQRLADAIVNAVKAYREGR